SLIVVHRSFPKERTNRPIAQRRDPFPHPQDKPDVSVRPDTARAKRDRNKPIIQNRHVFSALSYHDNAGTPPTGSNYFTPQAGVVVIRWQTMGSQHDQDTSSRLVSWPV
ncbi:unnamed protein product, partial [Ectocarpus sp. 12 AP-2014]